MKCLVCGKEIIKDHPLKFKYCSLKCRNKRNYLKTKDYAKQWQQNKRKENAKIPSPEKIQCIICGGWYKQVGSHIYSTHHITCREYREEFELEVKRGLLPPEYRKFKEIQCKENGTIDNLKIGKKYWFKEGQQGIGIYKRSPITMERLKKLHTLKKK